MNFSFYLKLQYRRNTEYFYHFSVRHPFWTGVNFRIETFATNNNYLFVIDVMSQGKSYFHPQPIACKGRGISGEGGGAILKDKEDVSDMFMSKFKG